MDIFDIRRRDLPSLDKYLDIKAKPFGGPKEAVKYKSNGRKSLRKYQRNINRDRAFEGNLTNPSTGKAMYQPNYDSYWAAIEQDRPSRDSNKKTQKIMYAKPTYFTKVEEGSIMRFDTFVNENMNAKNQDFDFNQVSRPNEFETDSDLGYEVDEEQLEQVLEEYSDDINELIEKIAEEFEIENAAVCELLCAAIEKLCNPDDDLEDFDQEDEVDQDHTDLETSEQYSRNRRYRKSHRLYESKWSDPDYLRNISKDEIRRNKDKIDWQALSRYGNLTEDTIREFKDRVAWRYISANQKLSEEFIKEFQDRVDWRYIKKYQDLSKDFKMEFKDRLLEVYDWSNSQYEPKWSDPDYLRNISKAEIRRNKDKIDWQALSRYGNLTEDTIREFQDRVDWRYIKKYQDLSKDFKMEFKDKLR